MHTNGDHSEPNGWQPGELKVADGLRSDVSAAPALPGPVQARVDDQGDQNQLRILFSALRRCWMLALSVGLLLGAAAFAAAWYLVPTPYTAHGDLRLQLSRGENLWDPKRAPVDMGTFKQVMMQRVREPFVITKALREPNIADCPTLRDKEFKDLWLQNKLEVRTAGPENIRISLSGEHPADLSRIVNAVIEAFEVEVIDAFQNDRRANLQKAKDVYSAAVREREDLKNQLTQISRRIESFNTAQNELRIQNQHGILSRLRDQLGSLQMQIIQKEVELTAMGGASPQEAVDNAELPEALIDSQLNTDPEYRTLSLTIANQQHLVRQYEQRTVETHPARIAAAEKLATLLEQQKEIRERQIPLIRQQLVAGYVPGTSPKAKVESELAILRMHEKRYIDEVERNKIEFQSNNQLMHDQYELQQRVSALDERVRMFDEDIFRREHELENGKPPIEKYMTAEVPRVPDQEKRMKLAGMSGAGAFGLAIALITWLEVMSRRINSAEDVEQNLKMRVVGTIPLMPRFITSGRATPGNPKTAYWQSVLTESIDSARTMLLRLAKTDGLKTVMIASATGGEGKTTLACHLASSLARGGRRVLLMDCDIRRPSVHEVFDVPNTAGVCEVLCERATLEDCIIASPQAGLFLLRAGHMDHETLQRLALDQFESLIREVRADYDFIVVDSAPILPVTDSLMLAQHVDGVMFSVRRDVSRVTKVSAAVQRLSLVGAPIIGVVTIGLDSQAQSYRYSHYYATYGYRSRTLPAPDQTTTTSAS
ncbi:MAG: polysaccharide biosynthesis tyrosine autokinase [Planctomyces sp.]|nr:polysaccharide biosynthesis tyrosine autokinase [Planctomyces sp.]